MYPAISEIVDKIDAVHILGEYVPLKKSGNTFKGLCPFHLEKTPSFHVNPQRGLWHCFGCGAGGDLITFLMKIENLSFPEARDWLGKKAGINLEQSLSAENKKRRRWHDILQYTAAFYQQTLFKTPFGRQALAYLDSRGVKTSTIERFQLGAAPASGQELVKHLKERNYQFQELHELGIIAKTDPPRDYFFKRIIFPICDGSAQVIGFGGRALGEEQPKYLNSPETPLFKKRETLYAFHLAKPQLIKQEFVILAEGYLDIIALHQFGFDQAVASLGTSLTAQQAKLLSRFARKLIICYDSDLAGFTAMHRAMSVVQAFDFELYFISLPQGYDPDSFLQKNGKDAFNQLLTQPLSPVDFLIHKMSSQVNLNAPEGKKRIMSEIVPLLKAMSDPILKDAYIKKTSESLSLSESMIRKLLENKTTPLKIQETRLPSRERDILSWILWEPSLAGMVWSSLSPDDFEDSLCREAAEALFRLWQEGKASLSELDAISEQVLSLLGKLSTQAPVGSIESVASLITAHKTRQTRKELSMLKQQISTRLKEGKVEPTDEAYQKYLLLLRRMKQSNE